MKNVTLASNIRTELKKYLQDSGLKSLVLGISGGIDSAICVALAKPVCDELGVKIIGRYISITTNKDDERERAALVGKAFCHDYKEINLSEDYIELESTLSENEVPEDYAPLSENRAYKIRCGNIKARMRMIYLYHVASLNGGMVLSTDNYTELMLGFWTIAGDIGDYGMVQNLWKMEVYDLSKYLALNECNESGYYALMSCVDATPTDGLGITNSDVEQLGAKNYAEVDDILRTHFEDKSKYCDHPVVKRHYASEFKRHIPYNLHRSVIVDNA